MSLRLAPVTMREAQAFVDVVHRHHPAPVGGKFAVGVELEGVLVAVATAGRPVARPLDDGWTLEVTRVASTGARNACSKLYGACVRAGRAMGYTRFTTYTLEDEDGASLRAAGWRPVATTDGGSWDTPSRRREDRHPTDRKTRWEIGSSDGRPRPRMPAQVQDADLQRSLLP